MSHKEESLTFEEELSLEESALLEEMLKGDFSGTYKEAEIPRREVYSPVPLSFGQRRLWILDQLVPGNAFYNVPMVYRLEGELNQAAFQDSVNEIVARHESLRTIFSTENDEPVQVIQKELKLEVPVISLEHLSGLEQEQEIVRLSGKEAMKPFDLATGPLMRVGLLRLGEKDHVLMYTSHHIVSDTWSSENFLHELVTLYTAFSLGRPSPLKELTIQYPDFALWQRKRMQGELLDKQLNYWSQILGPSIPILELPTDRPRPPVQNFNGESMSFALEEELCEKISALTLNAESSQFMFLLAALSLLFYRYSGQADILIGSPIANRTRKEIEGLIGYFSNTLVFRTDLTGNPTFRHLLERVRKSASGAYDNQDIPFEQLVEKFQPERYMSLTPLFQVMLVLQNVPKQDINVTETGFAVRTFSVHNKTCKFDLWISITQYGNVLGGAIEYNCDIFLAGTIKRLIKHFIKLLEEVVANPDSPIDELSIMLSEEKEQLLGEWNDTGRAYTLQCLHHLFTKQAKKSPDRIALSGPVLSFNGKDMQNNSPHYMGNLSYKELKRVVNKTAGLLRKQGLMSNETEAVGILADRSLEMVMGIFGVQEAGGAYLPLDPEYPEERIDYILQDSRVNMLLSDREKIGTGLDTPGRGTSTDNFSIDVVDLTRIIDRDAEADKKSKKGNKKGDRQDSVKVKVNDLDLESDISSLAYVIYTSGSTGKPKGTMIAHGGICNRLLWMQETYCLTAHDRVLQKTPFSFDVSVWEFFLPLLNGAMLVMAEPGGHKDSAYLREAILREKITTLHFVPSMLNVFLEEPGLEELSLLKRVICSGEALPYDYMQRFYQIFTHRYDGSDIELHNLYGPTEASVDVTAWTCERGQGRKTIPIGRPIANTQIYILDKKLEIVPVGIPGELHIAGIQLARGYLNRPELTFEKFISIARQEPKQATADQTLAPGRQRLYKTGDLARWQPDGSIEFLGRLDFQVKVRGIRIELGEIESTLRKHDGLQDSVVLAGEGAGGAEGKKLTAYLVPEHHYWQESYDKKEEESQLTAGQVSDWQGVFDEAYREEDEKGLTDPTFNTVGWNSSYSGEPLPAEEMRLWVDGTVERILALKADRVMEIGCGTGLFLFPIIPHCRSFLGTDIAARGLDYIGRQLQQLEGKESVAKVELLQRPADNFDGIAEGDLDLVILNSVVQYFPSADYLLKVLTGAAGRIKPGGHIFIGDVRHHSLLKAFHASVEFSKADDETRKRTILRRVINRMSMEQELLVQPDFFYALKDRVRGVKQVEVLIKYGRYTNELSKFRYDVILHIGNKDEGDEKYPMTLPGKILAWGNETRNLTQLRQQLMKMAKEPDLVVVTGIPNQRISTDIHVLNWLKTSGQPDSVGEYRQVLAQGKLKEAGLNPDDILELSRDIPYQITITPSPSLLSQGESGTGTMAAIFRHKDYKLPGDMPGINDLLQIDREEQPWRSYTNNPLLVKMSGQIVPRIKDYVKERLPEYMMPSHFVILEHLPLTANGKLDRETLTLYDPFRKGNSGQEGDKSYVEPQTPTQQLLTEIWASVLFLEKVGITDNFFELGGDSINAIQVVSRANREGYNLTIRDLYKNLTISELARVAEQSKNQGKEEDQDKTLLSDEERETVLKRLPSDVEIEAIHPVTPFQKHMLNHLLLDPAKENEPGLFVTYRAGRLGYGQLDIAQVQLAFEKVTAVYPYLRMAFMWEGLKEPVQVIYKEVKNKLGWYDWSGLPVQEREEKFMEFAQLDYQAGFRRDKPEVYRITLIKMEEGDYRFALTADYMRVDGWSTNLVMNTFVSYCFAIAMGESVETDNDNDKAYKEFHLWLRRQDPDRGEQFWMDMLKDCRYPTPLAANAPGNVMGQNRGFTRQYQYLSLEETHQLESALKKHQLVLSTIGWAAWSLVMSRYTSEKKVVFGILVSGRSSAQSFVETMVGQTLNVLPTRVSLSLDKPVEEWLREIWEIQVEMSQYEYTPQEKVRGWWKVPPEKHLFESYLVVMNFPGIRQGMKESQDNTRTVHDYLAQLEYPLRVDFYPGNELCLIMHYYRRYFNDEAIKKMLADLYRLVNEIPRNLHRTTGELLELI